MNRKVVISVLFGFIAATAAVLLPPAAPAGQEQQQSEDKTFVKDAPMRWELVRRLSEQALEEYLPKAGDVLKAFNSNEFDNERKYVEAVGRAVTAWSDVLLYQKKSDVAPGDQSAWADEYNEFLMNLSQNGKWAARWMAQQALSLEAWTKETENAPAKIEELKKCLLEADAVLSEAYNMMYGTWSKEQLKNAPALLERVNSAFNLFSAAMGSLIGMFDRGVSLGAKPEYSDFLKAVLNEWKGLPDEKSAVLKSLRQMPKDWIPLIQARREAAQKAWEAVTKAYEPILKKNINSGCKRFNGTAWESFVDAAKRDRDYFSRKIAGEGQAAALAVEQMKAEEATTEKERTRLVEISRLANPALENRLILAVQNADSDSERKAAETALAKYREEAAKLTAEFNQIVEKHRQRRKNLGIGPAF